MHFVVDMIINSVRLRPHCH